MSFTSIVPSIRLSILLVAGTLAWVRWAVAEDKPWPFYAPNKVTVPQLKDDRLKNEIDAFVLAKLRNKGLDPAPIASRQTLVRRLYFDLVGLPPTPEDVHAFVNDPDPEAYKKLVDRLLDDSRYGEKWARLWLDLARYADTAGYEGDPDLPNAWRYRDYVIDSFNRDKPYDLFIKEQLAGDEFEEIMSAGDLPGVPAENTVALTFLRLAPFTEPRGDETRHEMLSEMTSTVGSVFLGLTVGCAKCHDHKHDLIPTNDFYRMKAFFATVQLQRPEPGDVYQIGGPLPAEFYREGENTWAQQTREKLAAEVKSAKEELKQLTTELKEALGIESSGFATQVYTPDGANDYAYTNLEVNDGKLHHAIVTADGQQWLFWIDGNFVSNTRLLSGSNRGNWFGNVSSAEYISLGQNTNGTGKPIGGAHQGHFAEVLVYDHPLSVDEAQQISNYINAKYRDGGNAQVPRQGLRAWWDASDVDANEETANPSLGSAVQQWRDKINGIELAQHEDASLQPRMDQLGTSPAVKFEDDVLVGSAEDAEFIADTEGAIVIVFSATQKGEGYGFEVGGNGSFVATAIHPKANSNQTSVADALKADKSIVTKEQRRRFSYLSSRDQFVKQHLKRLQPLAMSLRHSYGPPFEPGVPTSRVMVRGEYDNPGKEVQPGFLSCITGNQQSAKIRLDPFKRWPTRSRRMALAQWIASPENPMTARVMVNRLWHWHFGRGIVPTTSDFGYLSGGPSHRELLDWLAIQFVQNKWSIKAMHRLIVNSSTYRQSSRREDSVAADIDPDNRLLWKANRRRMDAEAIRDAVLSVSGRLNPEQFGLPIFPPLPGDIADAVKYSVSKWDTQYGPEGRKRSIYIYQQRTLTMPFMQTFDALVCDDTRPRRRESVTSLQALAMYNGDFVNEEAPYFAQRVLESTEKLDEQIEEAIQLAFGRKPAKDELVQLRSLAKTDPSLTGLCRVLFNANEFIYID